MYSRQTHSGFSLIEVLLVVTLMGILAGMMISQFQPNAAEQLKAAGQILSTELAYARNLAVSNNDTYRLTFSVAENQIALEHTGANTLLDVLPASPFADSHSTPDKQITDLDDFPQMNSSVHLISVLADGTSVSSIEFDSLGSTTRPETTVIWLVSGEGSSARYLPLSVNPITGLATLGNLQATPPTSTP